MLESTWQPACWPAQNEAALYNHSSLNGVAMIYLGEREIGFDAAEIGFPAVLGCRAIVVVTGGGLFGYHLNGNLNLQKRTAFINFITHHAQGNGIRMIYAASAGGGLQADHQELRDIGAALHYVGAIYWASLPPAGSVFVHFQDIQHMTCAITQRAWNDPLDNIPANKAPYAAGANRAIANGNANANMFINASTVGLRAVYPARL
jgi:hypothetical protein